jgi:PPIC-type PPIASE domain
VRIPALPLLVLPLCACDRSSAPAPAPSWPAGTVLALDERPIASAEVEEAANGIALLEPRDSIDQLRRLALTNVVLPRCAAQAIDPRRRAEAQRLAQEWSRALESGASTQAPAVGPQLLERKGRMLDLGLELWTAAMALAPGHWSGVVETAGCFHIARVKDRDSAMLPGLVELQLEVYDFPYLDPANARDRIQAQLDRSHIVYVDEGWRALVPVSWQYRLRGGNP